MGTDFGSKIELIYFPVSGRALTSRLLLKSKGANFTDTQISFADWATSGIKDSEFSNSLTLTLSWVEILSDKNFIINHNF